MGGGVFEDIWVEVGKHMDVRVGANEVVVYYTNLRVLGCDW